MDYSTPFREHLFLTGMILSGLGQSVQSILMGLISPPDIRAWNDYRNYCTDEVPDIRSSGDDTDSNSRSFGFLGPVSDCSRNRSIKVKEGLSKIDRQRVFSMIITRGPFYNHRSSNRHWKRWDDTANEF